MRDAATAAAQSDPTQNRWFSRRWRDWVPLDTTLQHSEAGQPALDEGLDAIEASGHALLLAWRAERAQQVRPERAP